MTHSTANGIFLDWGFYSRYHSRQDNNIVKQQAQRVLWLLSPNLEGTL